MCNYLGNLAWTLDLEWSGQAAYNNASMVEYEIAPKGLEKRKKSTKGKKSAGRTRSANGLTYLQIYDAGHMVPLLVILPMTRSALTIRLT